ncbi:MAG: VanZ family protein [Thermoguttaceae bacterium]
MLRYIRFFTICLWLLCTALLLLPNPLILTGGYDVSEQVGTSYNHLLMFATLGFFIELSRQKFSPFLGLSFLCLYGGITEVLQHFIPLRVCDLSDFCQNCTGAFLGTLLGVIMNSIGRFTFSKMNRDDNEQKYGRKTE